jgi:hypothetical protein
MTPDSPAARGSYNRFLAAYEPLRTELYRCCRYLTRSPWDAEDPATRVTVLLLSQRLVEGPVYSQIYHDFFSAAYAAAGL